MTTLESKIETFLAPHVQNLGYELLDVEYEPRSRADSATLRLFVDHQAGSGKHIGLEDCVAVDHGLDPVMETKEFTELLPQGFVLEVSSPGLDRPLKKHSDYVRYAGNKAIVKTFRPLTEVELNNGKYFQHHQKQKNFAGVLCGIQNEALLLEVDGEKIHVPLALISKANLDVSSNISPDDVERMREKE